MSVETDDPKQCKDISESSKNKYVINEIQLGIWKVFIATQIRTQGLWQTSWETYTLITQLVLDVYKISPQLIYFLLLTNCWNGVKSALEMRLDHILLTQVELAVSNKADIYTTVCAIGCQFLHSVLDSYIEWADNSVKPALEGRLENHFQLKTMKAELMMDLATSTETPEAKISSYTALYSLQKIFEMLQHVFSVSSQLFLWAKVSHMKGGNVLFVVCLLQAIISKSRISSLWTSTLFAYVNNGDYKRAESLKLFADGTFRQDIISNNLTSWIVAEYRKAVAALGNTSTKGVYAQYAKKSPLFGITQDFLTALPSTYFAIMVLKYPQHLSIASIATFQNSRRSLLYSFSMIFYDTSEFRENLYSLRRMYAPSKPNIMKDGTSCLTEKEDTSSKGMSLVLRDVSFAYPGGGKKTDPLRGINLDIKPGQIVVIVGVNGSGKSTLTRILARLYDPSSGEVLVDGRPSTEYRLADLQRATALLTQDSSIFPLTLAENIGLGYPEHSSDLEMIKEAASEGGAAEFIEELEKGYQTILTPFDYSFHTNLDGDRQHPLWVMSDKMTKKSDISGGQRQRIVVARTFMRFKSGKVKLVIIDEPSSALDADAELKLFQRLLSAREGKTMVFVTHRFGHLTKFADQIICMKDGMIVESGSHGELMSAAGEYARLYKIQAQAFSEGA